MATITAPNPDFVLNPGNGIEPREYRRCPYDPGILHIDCRVLKPDGTPHGDLWYPLSDAGLLWMQRFEQGIAIIDRLWKQTPQG